MKHYAQPPKKERKPRKNGEAEKQKTKVFDKKRVGQDPMRQSEELYLNSEPKAGENSTRLRFVPAAVFAAFIFAMAIWFIFNPKLEYSSAEKRYLQKFPEVTLESVSSGKFGEEFESYFADHFPARNLWVGFNAYYNLGLGNNGSSGVYLCADDYLINKPVSKENSLDKNIGAIVDFKNTVNVPVSVMLAPSTGYIMEDKLPLIHDSYNDDSYFDKVSEDLSQNGIGFTDLRESFKQAAASGEQLYYRTDHHWTTAGAYLGYTKLCESLKITPIEKKALRAETYNGFFGTTYSTSGFQLTKPDSIQVWSNPQNTASNIHVKITEGAQVKEYDSLYFYNHLDEDDKYPVFLDGNHALTEITNSNAGGGTILLIKDSFSHSLAPFLAENYSKVILVDMRYYKQSVSDIVNSEKPEQIVVLYGIDNLATDTDIVWLK